MTEDIKQFKQEMLPEATPDELPIKKSSDGAVLTVGAFKSPNFSAGRDGWSIKSEGDAEFDDIKARGNMERNDFHWTTFFESLDGYNVAGGGVTLDGTGITMVTAGTGIDASYIIKSPTYNFNSLSWNKDRKIRTRIKFDDNTDQTIDLVSGVAGADSHIGFKVIDATLYGTVGTSVGGGSETTLSLGAISTVVSMALEINYKAGSGVTFVVDGVDLGTITEDLPTGDTYANRMMYFEITESAAAVKTMYFSFYDFWQGV